MRNVKDIYDIPLKILAGVLLLLGICSLSMSAGAPWVVLHRHQGGVKIVHFRDARVGWAAGEDSWSGQTAFFHTADGGLTWQHELTDFPYERASFIDPMEGWTFRGEARLFERTPLRADIKLYHSTDGGLNWQLQPGKITNIVNMNEDFSPVNPFEFRCLNRVYFVDGQEGWLLGSTEARPGKGIGWDARVQGLLFFHTSDGGKTWSGQIDVHPVGGIWHGPDADISVYVMAVDIDFVDPTIGWILTGRKWIYRTSDRGETWERLDTGYPLGFRLQNVDFVDAQHGWLVGDTAVSFTQDGGRTWANRTPNPDVFYQLVYFADTNEGWVWGSRVFPQQRKEAWIFHTADGGRTWQVEWESNDWNIWIHYLEYDLPTESMWAGGDPGLLLQRRSVVPLTPLGKLVISWGKLKKGAS